MEDRNILEKKSVEWYINTRPTYKKLAEKVESTIIEILELNNIAVHIVTSRSKTIESFKAKISNEKYDDPINQITDLAGIRIITYVEDDVIQVRKTIEDTFDIDKDKSLDKSKELGIDKVGYKSVHYVAKLKEDRLGLPEYKNFRNQYFEIQIRTILQHAWAEIEHDRNYKFSGKLPDEIARRFKLLAGNLESADREFNNIAKEIDLISKEVEAGTKSGKLNFEINSTSLKQYLETKFNTLWENEFALIFNIDEKHLKELENYGIHTLKELDHIVPSDVISQMLLESNRFEKSIFSSGLLRFLMIINDAEKYFQKSWEKSWDVWSSTNNYKTLYEYYKTNWKEIEANYDVKFSG